MEGHAAIPGVQDLQRVGEVEHRLVEQDVAKPAPQNHAEQRIDEEIIRFGGRQGWRVCPPQARLAGEVFDVPDRKEQPSHIGERIPVNGKGPEADRNRVQPGVGDGSKHPLLLGVSNPAAKPVGCGPAALESGLPNP